MNPKKIFTILHSQFNNHTLPVTPFKEAVVAILGDSPFIKKNVRNKAVLLIPLNDQKYGRYVVIQKCLITINSPICIKNGQVTFVRRRSPN